MIILYTEEEFKLTKSRGLLKLRCYGCGTTFLRRKHEIQKTLRGVKTSPNRLCSRSCLRSPRVTKNCKNCGNALHRPEKRFKTSNAFCNHKCGAFYGNTHKMYGYKRSKLEVWLETQLKSLYPDLEIHFNRKDAINSELDIYFPSIKLAIELNGIFHYEPIYGEEKLKSIQNNDNRKFQACLEKGIELCIIDSSKQKYFTLKSSSEYLNIINKLLATKGVSIGAT